jgi:hypothetical protein
VLIVLSSGIVAAVAIALAELAPSWAFYVPIVLVLLCAIWRFLAVVGVDDMALRINGLALALGHSLTLWFFENDARVLVPAQSLFPIVAMTVALWRGREASPSALVRNMTALAFGPLWMGLLTYLALTCRAEPSLVVLALASSWLAAVGATLAASSAGIVGFIAAGALAAVGALSATCTLVHTIPWWHGAGLGLIAGILCQVARLGAMRVTEETPSPLLLVASPFTFAGALVYAYVRVVM